jgi:hypothetical protein
MKVAILLAASVALSCSHPAERPPPPSAPPAAPARDPVASFEIVKAVLQSPRCVNCHPAGDAPLQGDDGHVHAQHVVRGPGGFGAPGLACSACHGPANPPDSYGPRMPPGVSTNWHLPPPEMKMVFEGLDTRELCEQIKDPERNGHKQVAELVEHVSSDPLVLWGWSPGYGRNPVPIAHAEFVSAFKAWADAGAPCAAR